MTIFATAGAKLFIGPSMPAILADYEVEDFTGVSWVEIGWTENLGQFGDESSEITFDAIGHNRTIKLKGIRNAGNMDLVLGVDMADPGQVALLAAEATPHDFAFRIDFNDAPIGGEPSRRYFVAKVMTAREQLDTANSVVRINATLGINSNIARVQATP